MPFQIGQPFEEEAATTSSLRIALVIGNKSYKVAKLRNPGNDALKVAAVLKRLGFEVKCLIDLTLEQMDAVLREFTRSCRNSETALIYYAGHGMQFDSMNLLVPVDFDVPQKETTGGYSLAVLKSTVNLAEILEATRSAMRTLIFLDACREFPEVSQRRVGQPVPELFRSLAGRGFAMLDADKERNNLVVSFAADAGKQALDGDRRNSPYTLAFSELAVKPIAMGKLLDDLRHQVYDLTDGRQRPREINTLVKPFSLTDGIGEIGANTVAVDTDDMLFADAVVLDKAEGYRYYLQEFPDGRHALLAHSALGRLTLSERVRVEAQLRECCDPPFFTPGRGLKEWFQDAKVAPQMVVIPAMPPSLAGIGQVGGAPDPARPFAVSRTPITFAQWLAAVAAGGVSFEPSDNSWGRGNRPVINVSWHQAQAYIDWLTKLTGSPYRLPTVAEWEHCCRGLPGDDIAGRAEVAGAKSSLFIAPTTGNRLAGQEPPNGLGLCDMIGNNVWEWCSDTGSRQSYRKAKGGDTRTAALHHTEDYYAGHGAPFIGFRVVREIR